MPTPVSLSQRGFSLKPDVAANSHGVVSLLHQSQLETIDWTPLAPRAVVAPRAVGCLLVANWGSLADPSILCALSCCKFGWWPNHFLGWLGLEISGAHNLCLLGCFVGVIYGGGSGFGFEMQSRFGVLLQGWCLYFSFSDSCLLIEVLALLHFLRLLTLGVSVCSGFDVCSDLASFGGCWCILLFGGGCTSALRSYPWACDLVLSPWGPWSGHAVTGLTAVVWGLHRRRCFLVLLMWRFSNLPYLVHPATRICLDYCLEFSSMIGFLVQGFQHIKGFYQLMSFPFGSPANYFVSLWDFLPRIGSCFWHLHNVIWFFLDE